MIAGFLSGYFRAYNVVTFFILYAYFKEDEHKHLVQIWFTMGMGADLLGIFLPEYLINNLGLDWPIAMTAVLGLLLISVVYMYIVTP